MVVIAEPTAVTPLATWALRPTGMLAVYRYEGRGRLALLLHLNGHCGVLLLNRRLLPPEGKRVAMGWALAIAEFGTDGYYAVFLDRP